MPDAYLDWWTTFTTYDEMPIFGISAVIILILFAIITEILSHKMKNKPPK